MEKCLKLIFRKAKSYVCVCLLVIVFVFCVFFLYTFVNSVCQDLLREFDIFHKASIFRSSLSLVFPTHHEYLLWIWRRHAYFYPKNFCKNNSFEVIEKKYFYQLMNVYKETSVKTFAIIGWVGFTIRSTFQDHGISTYIKPINKP